VKQTNSIFGLPEFYDDLLDEWTHEAHIEERNRVLRHFRQLADEKKVRITYFSGDIHCYGVSRFQTKGSHRPSPIHDAFQTKWEPVDDTEEEVIDFFVRKPENGRKTLVLFRTMFKYCIVSRYCRSNRMSSLSSIERKSDCSNRCRTNLES
jgi:hypothetical protein